jgi:biopolymer transport protein TolQ
MNDSVPAGMTAALPHDLSMISLFLQADPIVKGVMILLVVASIACWAIVFDKIVRIVRAGRDVGRFEAAAQADGGHVGGSPKDGLSGAILVAGVREWHDHSDEGENRAERRERIERAMRSVMVSEIKRLESGLAYLATVGSTAPFVGLFGTVWGIMNSFTAIAQSHDTSLAVVAPGIAEALFATALGLVAAIPAVIAYNKFATALSGLAQRLNTAIGEFGARMSRRPTLELAEAAR